MKLAIFMVILANAVFGFPTFNLPNDYDYDDYGRLEEISQYEPPNLANSRSNHVQNLNIDANYFQQPNANRINRRAISNLIPSNNFEQNKFREKGLIYQKKDFNTKRVPVKKLYYYSHPMEALRFEYQPLVRQTHDFEPLLFNPALRRPNHGYGFNEWGGHGIA